MQNTIPCKVTERKSHTSQLSEAESCLTRETGDVFDLYLMPVVNFFAHRAATEKFITNRELIVTALGVLVFYIKNFENAFFHFAKTSCLFKKTRKSLFAFCSKTYCFITDDSIHLDFLSQFKVIVDGEQMDNRCMVNGLLGMRLYTFKTILSCKPVRIYL